MGNTNIKFRNFINNFVIKSNCCVRIEEKHHKKKRHSITNIKNVVNQSQLNHLSQINQVNQLMN